MPHMDGYESTRQIREYLHYHHMKQPTIIAVTGHSEDSYIKKALDSGMNMVLSKPIDIKKFQKIFNSLNFEISPEKVER